MNAARREHYRKLRAKQRGDEPAVPCVHRKPAEGRSCCARWWCAYKQAVAKCRNCPDYKPQTEE